MSAVSNFPPLNAAIPSIELAKEGEDAMYTLALMTSLASIDNASFGRRATRGLISRTYALHISASIGKLTVSVYRGGAAANKTECLAHAPTRTWRRCAAACARAAACEAARFSGYAVTIARAATRAKAATGWRWATVT